MKLWFFACRRVTFWQQRQKVTKKRRHPTTAVTGGTSKAKTNSNSAKQHQERFASTFVIPAKACPELVEGPVSRLRRTRLKQIR
jgi:hypothetical protein